MMVVKRMALNRKYGIRHSNIKTWDQMTKKTARIVNENDPRPDGIANRGIAAAGTGEESLVVVGEGSVTAVPVALDVTVGSGTPLPLAPVAAVVEPTMLVEGELLAALVATSEAAVLLASLLPLAVDVSVPIPMPPPPPSALLVLLPIDGAVPVPVAVLMSVAIPVPVPVLVAVAVAASLSASVVGDAVFVASKLVADGDGLLA